MGQVKNLQCIWRAVMYYKCCTEAGWKTFTYLVEISLLLKCCARLQLTTIFMIY